MNHQNLIPSPSTDDDLINELKQLSNSDDSNPNTFVNISSVPTIQSKRRPPPAAPQTPVELELKTLSTDQLKKLLPDISKQLKPLADDQQELAI